MKIPPKIRWLTKRVPDGMEWMGKEHQTFRDSKPILQYWDTESDVWVTVEMVVEYFENWN